MTRQALCKPLAVPVCVLLILLLCAAPAVAAAETFDSSWAGFGTESQPYLITSANDLKLLADKVNAGNSYENVFFKVAQDIDLSSVCGPKKGNWKPIGQNRGLFKGNFDGDYHTISNLYIRSSASYLGLFGRAENATFKNIGLTNVNIIGIDANNVGSLVGHNSIYGNNAIISNCYATGDISGGYGNYIGGLIGFNLVIDNDLQTTSEPIIVKCFSTCNVTGNDRVGGLIGDNDASKAKLIITNCYVACYNTGGVSGTNAVGGLVGYNYAINGEILIEDCYTACDVSGKSQVGGITGRNSDISGKSVISQCYASGKISGTGECVGGITGSNYCDTYGYGSIVKCVALNKLITGTKDVGVLSGLDRPERLSGCYFLVTAGYQSYMGSVSTENSITEEFYVSEIKWDFDDVWKIDTECSVYPIFQWQTNKLPNSNAPTGLWSGSGTEDDPYLINNADDLIAIGVRNVEFSNMDKWIEYEGVYFKVTQDIDLSLVCGVDKESWKPIGSNYRFGGTFDGDNHTISNLYINGSGSKYATGLFGDASGSFKNIYLKDINVTGFTSGVGGLVGILYISYDLNSTIINCHTTGTVYADGGTGNFGAGGLIGRIDTFSSLSTITINDCDSTCSVKGNSGVGGFIGTVNIETGCNISINNCNSTGSVEGPGSGGLIGGIVIDGGMGSITNCYSTNSVTADGSSNGGFIGYTSLYSGGSSTITCCYSLSDVLESGGGGLIGSNEVHEGSTNVISNCYATGSCIDGSTRGGLIGENIVDERSSCTIANCYASGSVGRSEQSYQSYKAAGGLIGINTVSDDSNVYIRNSVSLNPSVAGSYNIGRIVGKNSGTDITNNYALETMICSASDGITISHSDSWTQSFYEGIGWDFDNVWKIDSTIGYPILRTVTYASIDIVDEDDKKGICSEHSKWTAWDKTNSLPTTAGNYCLVCDVSLSDEWSVPSGTINLCLNGHVINQTGSNRVISIIGADKILVIHDCSDVVHYFNKEDSGLWVINDKAINSPHSVTGGVIMGGVSGVDVIDGSGVYVKGGIFVMYGGNIVGNKADYRGGGIYSDMGKVEIYGGRIVGNTAVNGGGVCLYYNSIFNMTGGNIINNTARFDGGGVYVGSSSKFTMDTGNIINNIAGNFTERYDGSGGGIYVSDDGAFTLVRGNIADNIATLGGGGVFVSYNKYSIYGGDFKMWDGNITHNTAGYGGGVYVGTYSTFTMSNGNITGNTVKNNYGGYTSSGIFLLYGGGIYVDGKATIYGGDISDNRASQGGGMYVGSYGDVEMSGGNISDNTAYFGAGVDLRGKIAMTGDATVDANNVFYLRNSIDIVGSEFTGHVMSIKSIQDDMNGTPIVRIADDSSISAEKIINRFSLQNTTKKLVISDDGKTLIVADKVPGDDNNQLQTPIVISPTTNIQHPAGNSLSIQWTYAGDITPDKYTVELFREGVLYGSWDVTSKSCKIPADTLIQTGRYSVDVYPKKDGHTEQVWGNVKFDVVKSFEITNPSLGQKVSPNVAFSVTWTYDIRAEKYLISLRDINTEPGTLLYNHTDVGYSTSFTIPANKLVAGHPYRVAVGACKNGITVWDECEFVAANVGEEDDGIIFDEWTPTSLLPTTAGNYKLMNDVSISSTWNVPTGETNLDLNGHSIAFVGEEGRVIYVESGVALNLYDRVGTGKITGGNAAGSGGGVFVNSGMFNMYGGTISGNTADDGGGVYVGTDGTFTMSDGTISSNTAKNYGGGVYVGDSVFNMIDGKIQGNTAYNGGGVCVYGTIDMSGGNIVGNDAKAGGGVFCGATYAKNGTLKMSGGNIQGNTVDNLGNGVFVEGDLVISGDATINADNDVCLSYSKVMDVIGSEFTGSVMNIRSIDERTDGTPIVRIAGNSPISAENIINKFALQSDTKKLIIGDDGKSLIVADKTSGDDDNDGKLQNPIVTSPINHSEHLTGNPLSIQWTYTGDVTPDKYEVKLLREGVDFGSWFTTSKSYTIPADKLIQTGNYSVYVYPKKAGHTENVLGNVVFEVVKSFEITSPTAGQKVSPATAFTVTWTNDNAAEKYLISLRDINTEPGTLLYNHTDVGYTTSFTLPANRLVAGHPYRVAVAACKNGITVWDECEFVAGTQECLHTNTKYVEISKIGITKDFPMEENSTHHYWYEKLKCGDCGAFIGSEKKVYERHAEDSMNPQSQPFVCKCNHYPVELPTDVETMYAKEDTNTYITLKINKDLEGGSIDEDEEVTVFNVQNTYLKGWKLIKYSVDRTNRFKIRFVEADKLEYNEVVIKSPAAGIRYFCDEDLVVSWEVHGPIISECIVEIKSRSYSSGFVGQFDVTDGLNVIAIPSEVFDDYGWYDIYITGLDKSGNEVSRDSSVIESLGNSEFNFNTDTWNFENSEKYFAPYLEYHFELDFYNPLKMGIKWEDFVAVYGDNEASKAIYNTEKDWGGSCFGMITTLIAIENNVLPVDGFFKDQTTYKNIRELPMDAKHEGFRPSAKTLGQFINQMQLYQAKKDLLKIRGESLRNYSGTFAFNYYEVESLIDTNSIVEIDMLGNKSEGYGSHAILGYATEIMNENNDGTLSVAISVYDPNYSNGKNRKIIAKIDKTGAIIEWIYVDSSNKNTEYNSKNHALCYISEKDVIGTCFDNYYINGSVRFMDYNERLYIVSDNRDNITVKLESPIDGIREIIFEKSDVVPSESEEQTFRIYCIPEGEARLVSENGGTAIISDLHSSIELTLDKGTNASVNVDDTKDNSVVIDSDAGTPSSFTVTYGYDETAGKGYQSLSIQGTTTDTFTGNITDTGIEATGLASAKIVLEDDNGVETTIQEIQNIDSYDEVHVNVAGDTIEVKGETDGVESLIVSVPKESESTSIEPIIDTRASANAITPAMVKYRIAPSNISELVTPLLTRNGKSIPLDDSVIVNKTVNDVEISVPATVNLDGTLNIKSSDISGADSITVTFIGRKIGDTIGNGRVDVSSNIKIARVLAGLAEMTEVDKFYGDINADGKLKVDDNIMLARYLAGILDENFEVKT